ncbi:MAG TPA: MgtC/SapB family protein [Candidatus Paceibacterota bacterium]|nr:MgtC/SapB family protein [Candidatus Paceibacterota bacterium]
MLTFEQMLGRLIVALVLGAILGVERELVGKEAGVRTEMIVSGGASILAMIALALPYIAAQMSGTVVDLSAQAYAFTIIANVVVGIGFLGAGLIIKMNDHPRGITTAALVWTTAAIGILAGIGLFAFATAAAIIFAFTLYILRKLNISEKLERHPGTPD